MNNLFINYIEEQIRKVEKEIDINANSSCIDNKYLHYYLKGQEAMLYQVLLKARLLKEVKDND